MALPVSVYVITLNEAENLRRLLPQLSGFDEVVIVDGGSTDATRKVACSFPNVHFYMRAWSGFSDQKNFALSLCSHDWVLNLDADEELTSPYLAEMHTLLQDGNFDALQTRRKLLRWGKVPRTFMKDDVLIRFFRRQCAYYPSARVHEKLQINGRVKASEVHFLHHENLSFNQRIAKSNKYSELKALDKFSQGKQVSLLHLVLVFPLRFLQCYLGKGCFMDGVDGMLTSMNVAWYGFMQYARLWELNRRAQAQQAVEASDTTAPLTPVS